MQADIGFINKEEKVTNKNILENINNLNNNINNRSNMTVLEKYIPKDRLLELYLLTNCGSTTDFGLISSKSDYYKYIEEYMKQKNPELNYEELKSDVKKSKKVKDWKIDDYKLNRLLWGLNP